MNTFNCWIKPLERDYSWGKIFGFVRIGRASQVAKWYRIRLSSRRSDFDPWAGKIPWTRKWQPTSVFLPREFCGWMSLVGPSPWDCKVSDVTEQLTLTFTFCCGICSMNLLFLTTTSWLVYSDTITTCLLLVGECYFRWSLMCMDGVEWVSLQSVRLSVSKSPVQSFKL